MTGLALVRISVAPTVVPASRISLRRQYSLASWFPGNKGVRYGRNQRSLKIEQYLVKPDTRNGKMKIHHSIVKSAAAKGVELSIVDDEAIQAKYLDVVIEKTIEDEDGLSELARDAIADCLDVVAFNDDPMNGHVRIKFEDGDFAAYADVMKGGYTDEIARDPVLEDLIVSIQEWKEEQADADGEDADEEEERGSVVPAKYKALYAEAGHPTHCGDWLAETLNRFCRVVDGETGKETTDLDALETIANANGVAPERYGKLGIATNGWQGRYRMTIRNMLTPRCAEKGFIFIPSDASDDGADKELKAPEAWAREHAPKVKAKPVKTDAEKAKQPDGKASAKTKAKKEAPSVNEMRKQILDAENA